MGKSLVSSKPVRRLLWITFSSRISYLQPFASCKSPYALLHQASCYKRKVEGHAICSAELPATHILLQLLLMVWLALHVEPTMREGHAMSKEGYQVAYFRSM